MTHLLTGWALANLLPLERRDRAIVTLAAVAPDVDAFGLVFERVTEDWAHPLYWYSEYHHVLAHNLGFALLVAGAAAMFSRRWKPVTFLAGLSFHLHLLEDLVGSRGPDDYQWPIPYLSPFSDRGQLTWSGQWTLDAWPNVALTAALLALTLYWSWRRERSPVELVSARADSALAATLRARFGAPRSR